MKLLESFFKILKRLNVDPKRFYKGSSLRSRDYANRAPRIPQQSLNHVLFYAKDLNVEESLLVSNLSSTGMGLIADSPGAPQVWPAAGSSVFGILEIEDCKFEIEMQIVHISHDVVGCQFQSPSADLTLKIHNYFENEIEALRLVKFKSEVLAKVPVGNPNLFVGQNSCEVYYVEDQGQVLEFHISFLGNYVDGGQGGKAQFGSIKDEEIYTDDGPRYKSASLIRRVPVSDAVVASVIKFVNSMQEAPEEIRHQICEAIHKAKR